MDDSIRNLPWSNISTWVVLASAAAFLGLGLLAYFLPLTSAGVYGVPLAGDANTAFVRAMGARNIGLSLLAIILIYLDLRAGLAALLIFAGLIAALDATIVSDAVSLIKALKHIAYTVALMALGLFFALRG